MTERFRTIEYRVSPEVGNDDLNDLFRASWPKHTAWDFSPALARSLAWVCAFEGKRLVGFVNLAWDGGRHAFILDTTVHPDFRRRGIGRQLVLDAVKVARQHGLEWAHVDYEPHLREFYASCGFRDTLAGVIALRLTEWRVESGDDPKDRETQVG
ncbi:MAG TPA: GNAT family N-acetyltransferase [Thermomicrobiales bacterium]|nr:GNAT family N-acetyltransferase [Thermomicrobiales bacterium]